MQDTPHHDVSVKLQAVMVSYPAFSGVVLARQAGEIVFGRGYGYANRAEGIPNTLHTRFATASGTKTFTSVAVCQLIDQGKIGFDTPIKDCIPQDFPCKDGPATVHHLLCHTGGLPDYYDEDLSDEELQCRWKQRPVARVRRPADVLPMFPAGPIKFPPGEGFSYSNGGYVLLGLVIEAASGMTYTDYVAENVFQRAGMLDSGYFPLDALPPRTALGYMATSGYETNIYVLPELALPDGGAFVTAPDMGRFWHALRTYQLLKPETTTRMMTPHAQAVAHRPDRWYGYGLWMTRDLNTGDVTEYQALGGDAGAAFISSVYSAQDVELTIIGNDDEMVWQVVSAVQSALGLMYDKQD